MQKGFASEPVRDQLLTRPNSKIGTYIEAIARRPVGACKIMITHIRCIEKMHLIQIRSVPGGNIPYSPEVEGAIPHQITNQTRLSTRSARHTLVPPVHVDRPCDSEEEHKSIVPELPRYIHG
jgi:hypothetical protein